MCIKITDIQKKRAGDVTITSNCSPFTGQEETLALKKKKKEKKILQSLQTVICTHTLL